MANRLAQETSPYLLQHAENPVDWFPWSAEALARAKSEDKPIFLSIGYSACHWCHVMEHESFEDLEIAAYLNEHFVNIKVDREERPDLDHIYMQTVMALRGGQGGWPLSAFLTPEGHVFFGGTYWPPRNRVNMPGFDNVIRQVRQAFNDQRTAIDDQGRQITQWLIESMQGGTSQEDIHRGLLANAFTGMQRIFDGQHGGFGSAPKFPHPMDLQLLLRMSNAPNELSPQDQSESIAAQMLNMVETTLDKMAYGGIHDHLGGGFYRYSVDAQWLIPHFEKMLYDNAQLLRLYTETFLVTGNPRHLRIAEKIVQYLTRDMLDTAGGFHSSEDADSEGEEGKFYVWTPEQVEEILGPESGQRFCQLYDVTAGGNFEGNNNLNLSVGYAAFAEQQNLEKSDLQVEMRESRQKLLAERERRVRPGKDDKILTSWNALALDALAFFNGVANDPALDDVIEENQSFAIQEMIGDSNQLLHSYRHGHAKIDAFLDDHAYLINALCTRAASIKNIDLATGIADQMVARFWDEENGGFFFTPIGQTDVIVRFKDHHDGSIPSGNGMAAFSLIRLGRLTGDPKWNDFARRTIEWALPTVKTSPLACGQMLLAIDLLLKSPLELIAVLPSDNVDSKKWIVDQVARRWLPHASFLCGTAEEFAGSQSIKAAVYQGKQALEEQITLYVCSGYECETPLIGTEEIEQNLAEIENKKG